MRALRFAALFLLIACTALLAAACAKSKAKPSASLSEGTSSERTPSVAEIGDPQKEIERAQGELAKDPNDTAARFRLGQAFLAANQPDSAAAAFEKILEKNPKDVKALVHHGLALEDLNRHEQAESEYRKAIEIAPNDPLPYINLGSLLYFHSKRPYEAKTAFSKAIEIDPKNPDAHFNLGVMFADANLYQEAKIEWEEVLKITENGPAAALAKENLERIGPHFNEQTTQQDSTGAPSQHP
jgi:tetratricopeptide (TPR) repeat protein